MKELRPGDRIPDFYTPDEIRAALKALQRVAEANTHPLSARTLALVLRDYLKAAEEGKLAPESTANPQSDEEVPPLHPDCTGKPECECPACMEALEWEAQEIAKRAADQSGQR